MTYFDSYDYFKMLAVKVKRAITGLLSEPIFDVGSIITTKHYRHEDLNALVPIEQKFNTKEPTVELRLRKLKSILNTIKVKRP